MSRVAILQSNYLPWRGYFDLIAAVDEFIVYDDAQYTKSDWRNRNLIKTPQGTCWLTVPVRSGGRLMQSIRDARIEGIDWAARHWKSLHANYRRAPHFDAIAALLEPVYTGAPPQRLSVLNRALIDRVCGYLGIGTRITDSCDYALQGDRTGRLVSLCEQAGASVYVSGPAARAYLDEARFAQRGIAVEWFDYDGLPEYPQLWGAFCARLSVVDLLFNCGARSAHYLRHVGERRERVVA